MAKLYGFLVGTAVWGIIEILGVILIDNEHEMSGLIIVTIVATMIGITASVITYRSLRAILTDIER